MAEVGSVEADGVHLIFAGADASQKGYKRLASAGTLAAGDIVLAASVSGTYVVLGKILEGGSL